MKQIHVAFQAENGKIYQTEIEALQADFEHEKEDILRCFCVFGNEISGAREIEFSKVLADPELFIGRILALKSLHDKIHGIAVWGASGV